MIGQRIRSLRKQRGLTQKQLGMAAGFGESEASVRIYQYESGHRTPPADVIVRLGLALGVSPYALNIPNADTPEHLMHTLFALEDVYGIRICEADGKTYVTVDQEHCEAAKVLCGMLAQWKDAAEKVASGEISREEYDSWRYNFSAEKTGGK